MSRAWSRSWLPEGSHGIEERARFERQYGAEACPICFAADSRDDRHKHGCPEGDRLTEAEVRELMRICIAGWAAGEKRRMRAGQRAKGAGA